MESLFIKFTNKYICFHSLFIVREEWNKGQLFKGVKRLRTTALKNDDSIFNQNDSILNQILNKPWLKSTYPSLIHGYSLNWFNRRFTQVLFRWLKFYLDTQKWVDFDSIFWFDTFLWFIWSEVSDSVTRVNDSTRVTIFCDSKSTRVTLRKIRTRVTFFTKWLESTRVRAIFAKSQSLWSTNPVCLHTMKWSFFGPVMIKIGENFLFWLSSRVMLYPKGQVMITCTKVDLRFAFHWEARRAQYRPIDTSSWSNQVFAYHDNGSRPHTVTLSLFQMKWFKLFEYKSNAKIYSSI